MQLIVLFGSRAQGNETQNSDLDVAVVLKEKPDLMELTSKLIQETGINNVDVVDLQRCDPVLGMQILEKGKVLYREKGALGKVGSYISRRYADTKKFRKAVSDSIDIYLGSKGAL
jgi:hypothetical protein